MPDVRALNSKKYGISRHRFAEIYQFCMQYREWKDELRRKTDTLGGNNFSGMPKAGGISDPTAELAVKRAELRRKCELVEKTAEDADPQLSRYILKAVTTEGISYNYLKMVMNIPCGKNMYYDRRRKFYRLMDGRI